MVEKIGSAAIELTTDPTKLNAGLSELQKTVGTQLGKSFEVLSLNLQNVNKIANGFLAGPAIRNAEEYAAAVAKIGGVSKLTATDQERVNKVMQEALAHYKVLGTEAPTHIKRLADEAKYAAFSTTTLVDSAKYLLPTWQQAGVAAAALGAGVVTVTAAIIKLGERGAAVNDVTDAFNRLTVDGPKALEALRKGVGGLLTDFDLMKGANAALSAGFELNTKDAYTLSRAAWVLSDAQGKDLKESYDTLFQAMATGKVAALASLGVTVEQKGASAALKTALDAEGEAISTSAQKAANRQAVIEALNKVVLAAGDQELDFAEKMTRAKVQVENMTDSLGAAIAVSPTLNAALNASGDALQEAFGADQTKTIQQIASAIDQFAIAAVGTGQVVVSVAKYSGEAFYGLRAVVFEVLADIATRNLAFLRQLQTLALASAALPGGVGAGMRAVLPAITDAIAQLEGISQSFVNTSVDAANSAVLWGKRTDALGQSLGVLKGRMIEAAAQGTTATAIAKALADAHKDVADGIAKEDTETAALTKSAKELQKHLDNLKTAGVSNAEILNRLGKDASELVIKFQAGGLSASKLSREIHALAGEYALTQAQAKGLSDGLQKILGPLSDVTALLKHDFEIDIGLSGGLMHAKVNADSLQAVLARMPEFVGFFKKEIKDSAADTKVLDNALGDLSRSFAELSQISGGSFSEVAKAIGSTVSAINLVQTGLKGVSDAMKDVEKNGFSAANLAGLAGDWLSIGVALYSVAQTIITAIDKARNETIKLETDARTLAALQKDFAEFGKAMGQVIFKPQFSSDLLAKIEADILRVQDRLHGAFAQAQAEALNLSQIIEELGGLNAQNLSRFEARARPLFDLIARGGKLGADAQKVLNDLVSQFMAQADKTGGLWDANLQKIIADAKAAGIELQAVTDAIAKQQDLLSKGLIGVTGAIGEQAAKQKDATAAVKDAQKAYDDLVESGASQDKIALAAAKLAQAQENVKKVVVTSQDEFDRLSRIALAAFNTLIASGVGTADAMRQIGPSIDALIANADAFGLSGNAAFNELSRWRGLVADNEALLGSVAGLNTVMTALANLGGLTAETFADLQAQGLAGFEKLTKAGFTENEALVQMKPFLLDVIKLAKDKNFEIDEGTKKLIAQAYQQGILTNQELSTNDILMLGLKAVIEALGGKIPEAFKTMAEKAEEAAKKMKDDLDRQSREAATKVTDNLAKIPPTRDVDINYAYHTTGMPDWPDQPPDGMPDYPSFAVGTHGHYLTRPLLARVHPGEAITPRSTVPQLARDIAAAMGPLVGDVTHVINLDGRELTRSVSKRLPGRVKFMGGNL